MTNLSQPRRRRPRALHASARTKMAETWTAFCRLSEMRPSSSNHPPLDVLWQPRLLEPPPPSFFSNLHLLRTSCTPHDPDRVFASIRHSLAPFLSFPSHALLRASPPLCVSHRLHSRPFQLPPRRSPSSCPSRPQETQHRVRRPDRVRVRFCNCRWRHGRACHCFTPFRGFKLDRSGP